MNKVLWRSQIDKCSQEFKNTQLLENELGYEIMDEDLEYMKFYSGAWKDRCDMLVIQESFHNYCKNIE